MTESNRTPMSKEELLDYRDSVLSMYYPDEVTAANKSDVTIPCPYNPSCGNTLVFDDFAMFDCSSCGKMGLLHEYVSFVEGISTEEALLQIDALLKRNGSIHRNFPDLTEIDTWHQDLMSGQNMPVKDYLNKMRGLNDDCLQQNKVGYYSRRHEIVLPILNATKRGLAGVKFMRFSGGELTGEARQVGEVRILGFHELRISNDGAVVYITKDELDALVLRQQGFFAITAVKGVSDWNEELCAFLTGKHVVICFGSSQEESKAALAIMTLIADIATSTKLLNINTGLGPDVLIYLSDYFSKAGNTKIDFESTVKNIRPMKKGQREILAQIQEERAKGEPPKEVNLAQDFVDGEMSYAVVINNQPSLIRSDSLIVSLDDIRAKNLYTISNTEFPATRFGLDGIQDYVSGAARANPAAVFDSVKTHIKKFVFLKNEDVYTVLALWVIGTYVFKIFSHFPYVHISAERGSGKSNLMEVLSNISFNGDLSVGSTEAVIFRNIELNSPTLFLDEVERLQKNKSKGSQALVSILNDGYAAAGKVRRVVGGKLVSFDTYSPKMFAGIEDISETLSDRSIKIRMLRKLNTDVVERYDATARKYSARLRDDLYIFGLNEARNIADKYENQLTKLSYLDGIENRALDVWAPILIIADVLDSVKGTGLAETIASAKSYMEEDAYLHKIADTVESEMIALARTLKDMIDKVAPIKQTGKVYRYTTDTVLEFFQERNEFKDLKTTATLTRILGKIGIRSVSRNVGGNAQRCYDIDSDQVQELGLRYGAWDLAQNPAE